MADLIPLSCSNSLQRSSSLLNNLHPIVGSRPNSLKRACGFVDSVGVVLGSVAPPPISCKPRKQMGLHKVQAVVAEATDQPKWWEKNAGPNMIDIHSTDEFLSALSEAGDRLVVVDFYGTWCASCRALFPKLCRLAKEHPEILFLKVNFDENKPMCKSMNVKVLPYFHFYRGAAGKVEAFSCSLAKFQKLKEAIETHNLAGGKSTPTKAADELRPESSSSSIEDETPESNNPSSSVEDESPKPST